MCSTVLGYKNVIYVRIFLLVLRSLEKMVESAKVSVCIKVNVNVFLLSKPEEGAQSRQIYHKGLPVYEQEQTKNWC